MSVNADNVGESAQTVSDASAFVGKAAGAASESRSTLGRIGSTVSTVSLGARLLPTALRLIKRYPLGATLTLAGVVWMLYSARSRRLVR
jgi:hypothetical protein